MGTLQLLVNQASDHLTLRLSQHLQAMLREQSWWLIHLTALRVSPVTLSKGLCTHFHKSSSQRRLWQLQLRLVNLRLCFMHFNYSRQRESASFLDLDLVNSLAHSTLEPQFCHRRKCSRTCWEDCESST